LSSAQKCKEVFLDLQKKLLEGEKIGEKLGKNWKKIGRKLGEIPLSNFSATYLLKRKKLD